MANFSILLAPSAEKKSGGNPFAPDMFDYRTSNTFNYFHELNPERRHLISALHAELETGQDFEHMLLPDGDALEHAIETNLSIYDAPLMSALDRFSPGVLYNAMNFQALPTGAQRRLLENGIIFSGLFGVLRPDDLIPEYYLDIEAEVQGIGKVSDYWREVMSPLLNERLTAKFVWNLLPDLYASAWNDEHTYKEMVIVKFARRKGGKLTPVADDGPPAGQFINFIVREATEDLEPVRGWTHPEGYKFDMGSEEFDEETKTRHIVLVKRG